MKSNLPVAEQSWLSPAAEVEIEIAVVAAALGSVVEPLAVGSVVYSASQVGGNGSSTIFGFI